MTNLERQPSVETQIDPKLAEEFLILTRQDPHGSYRLKDLSEEQKTRAIELIDEIVESVPGINKDSLTKIMFDSPLGKNVPGKNVVFGWYDFGQIENFDQPPKGFYDQYKGHRILAEEYYQIGPLERKLLVTGWHEVSKNYPSPIYILHASAA